MIMNSAAPMLTAFGPKFSLPMCQYRLQAQQLSSYSWQGAAHMACHSATCQPGAFGVISTAVIIMYP